MFYDRLLQKLVDALVQPPDSPTSEARESQALATHLILDLLTFCARSHSIRIRYYVLHNPMMQTLFPLLKHRAKCVRLSFLRLFRALVGTKEEPICRFVARNDMLVPILELLESSHRDGMLRSAALELFDFVVKQNLKTLIGYLAERHRERVGRLAGFGPFRMLGEKFGKLAEEGCRLTETAMSALCKRPYAGDGSLVTVSGNDVRRDIEAGPSSVRWNVHTHLVETNAAGCPAGQEQGRDCRAPELEGPDVRRLRDKVSDGGGPQREQ